MRDNGNFSKVASLRTGVPLATFAIILLTLAVVTTLEKIKYPLAASLKQGDGLAAIPDVILGALTLPDYLLLFTAISCMLAVLFFEARGGVLSQGLYAGRRREMALLFGALLLWFGQAYLTPGQLITGDAPFHISRIAHFRYGLESGKWLFWNNYWGLGVPFLEFTGPLLFWLGGLLDLLLRDPTLTSKSLLLLCHLAAGWFSYLLLRSFGLSRFAALVAALAFVGAWAHGHMVVLRGALPQALIYALLPAAFLLLERLVDSSIHRGRYWLGLVAVSALLLLNHPSTGLYVGVLLAAYTLANLLVGRYRWADLSWVASAGAAGVVASLFVVLPVISEQDWVTMISTERLLRFASLDMERLEHLLLWNNGNTGPGSNFDAYLGLSMVLLATTALGRLGGSGRCRLTGVFLVMLVLALILSGPHVRTVVVVGFMLAVLVGLGVDWLLQKHQPVGRWPLWILLALFLDLGLIAIQPLARTDKNYFITAGQYLERMGTQQRWLSSHSYDGPLSVSLWSSPLLSYRIQQTSLPHGYSATLFHNYGAVIYKRAEKELRDAGRLSASTEQRLALLNIGGIVNDNGHGFDMPDSVASVSDPVMGDMVEVSGATPMVFASGLEQSTPIPNHDKPVFWGESFDGPNEVVDEVNDYVDQVHRRMAYDSSTGFARRLMVRELPLDLPPSETAGSWQVKVKEYKVDFERINLSLVSERPGYVRLAHAWYPTIKAVRNGEAVQVLRESTGLMVLPLVAGVNVFEVRPVRTPQRVGLDWFTVGWVLIIVLLAWWLERRKNQLVGTPSVDQSAATRT